MNHKKLFKLFSLTLLCISVFTQKAEAYIDPGSGSMIMQIFIAVIGSIGYAASLYWGKFTKFLEEKKKKKK